MQISHDLPIIEEKDRSLVAANDGDAHLGHGLSSAPSLADPELNKLRKICDPHSFDYE